MDEVLVATRRALHGVAELVIAGPQYRATGTIRLRVTRGGFGGVATDLRVDGTELVHDGGRIPLRGSARELAAAAGVQVGRPAGLYPGGSGVDCDEPLVVDPAAAAVLLGWLATGAAGLRAFAAEPQPVLWPEHLDVGIALDEVNYGVSPGDADHPRPYAYVGPWMRRPGPFWNSPLGAVRPADELRGADALAAFFAAGRQAAAA